jgi:hypothetical protein
MKLRKLEFRPSKTMASLNVKSDNSKTTHPIEGTPALHRASSGIC